jgi:hypothetical protein
VARDYIAFFLTCEKERSMDQQNTINVSKITNETDRLFAESFDLQQGTVVAYEKAIVQRLTSTLPGGGDRTPPAYVTQAASQIAQGLWNASQGHGGQGGQQGRGSQ